MLSKTNIKIPIKKQIPPPPALYKFWADKVFLLLPKLSNALFEYTAFKPSTCLFQQAQLFVVLRSLYPRISSCISVLSNRQLRANIQKSKSQVKGKIMKPWRQGVNISHYSPLIQRGNVYHFQRFS